MEELGSKQISPNHALCEHDVLVSVEPEVKMADERGGVVIECVIVRSELCLSRQPQKSPGVLQ